MIIHHEQRWVYVGVPKTASYTLHWFFAQHCGGVPNKVYGPWHSAAVPIECHDYLIVASVRNPYSRVASLWRNRFAELVNYDETRVLEMTPDVVPFADFVRTTHARRWHAGYYNRPQMEWLDEAPRIDRFIRLETLEENLLALPFIDELPNNGQPRPEGTLPRLPRFTGAVPWFRAKYNPHTARQVREWAARDFEELGYDAEQWEGVW